MSDAHALDESSRPALDSASRSQDADTLEDTGTLVAWSASTGDGEKSHVVLVDSTGLAWALGLKKPEEFGRLVGEATSRPAEAAALIASQKGGRRLPREQLARVAYTEQLNQLTVVDKGTKKQNIAYGNDGEQLKILEAVRRHLGGSARVEDADAWSVMQVPLFALAVTAVIGGFFIWFTTISSPDAEISGRRSGMKELLNWLGYTIGPMWMSIAVGALALFITSIMVYLLVKRPQRQVLEF